MVSSIAEGAGDGSLTLATQAKEASEENRTSACNPNDVVVEQGEMRTVKRVSNKIHS